MAVNELAVVHFLMGGQLPAQKWAAATSPITDTLPIVPLLGALRTIHCWKIPSSSQFVKGQGKLSMCGFPGHLLPSAVLSRRHRRTWHK